LTVSRLTIIAPLEDPVRAIARFVSARRTAWIALVLAAIAVAALFAFLPKGEADAFPPSGLPESSQARQVSELLERFPSADTTVGILVFSRDGEALTEADTTAIAERAEALAADSTAPRAVVPQPSEDGTAALVAVPLDASDATDDLAATADALRTTTSGTIQSTGLR
jgi:RND superfamily putative drug exporter